MAKKIYYNTVPDSLTPGPLHIPVKNNKNSFSGSVFSYCPAWNHQNSRTFTAYASSNLHLEYGNENSLYSNNLNQEEFDRCIEVWNDGNCDVIQIHILFSNFYWTYEKNIWVSVLPHPLTALNNNFYHCGAWFNLSNWPRTINIGAIVVDRNKPLIIKRGDPLYLIKFHTEDQNDKFNLIQHEIDKEKYFISSKRATFIDAKRHSQFDFLWKNRFLSSFKK
jgi:hypothetical protein